MPFTGKVKWGDIDMLPRVIIHNSVSLDSSFLNFEVNMGLHYQIAANYRADAHLIGSNTAKTGIEMYGGKIPPEENSDFEKPIKDETLPYWVIIDTKGVLKDLLHIFRRFEFSKDVIVLISKTTPEDYIQYLSDRKYDHHIVGDEHVNLKKALHLLSNNYGTRTVLTDTGRILGNLLLNQRLADEISLLTHPCIVGDQAENLFKNITSNIKLKTIRFEVLDDNYIWQVYQVEKQ